LWHDIVKATQNALSIGAQIPMPTDYEFVEDNGIRFFVRILSRLHEKDEARKKQHEKSLAEQKTVNPFLPFDKNMFVADISETHVALLNKFNVVEHHLLIVTRHFEDQENLLTFHDLEALWAWNIAGSVFITAERKREPARGTNTSRWFPSPSLLRARKSRLSLY